MAGEHVIRNILQISQKSQTFGETLPNGDRGHVAVSKVLGGSVARRDCKPPD